MQRRPQPFETTSTFTNLSPHAGLPRSSSALLPQLRKPKTTLHIEMGAVNPASSNNPPITFNAHRKSDAMTFLDLFTDPENFDDRLRFGLLCPQANT
ncbi:hypothetical protein BCR44DRAFT_34057 [Catenaria anguillulae PL171]|uniref:Uncharacterized protein n=1 Tax=Catenaria anguillulae PL171 TaxID=765915 RepID=A0A1Y2HUG4_9FUNG|nr:hypothetical protein BCR44DRAFT_34057 [Catenaria anguillulae PL171]